MYRKLIMTILIFLFIYSPPVLPTNTLYLVASVCYILIIIFYRKEIITLLKIKSIFLFLTTIFFAWLFGIIIIAFTSKDFAQLNQIISIIILVVPTVSLITFLFYNYRFNVEEVLKIILNAAFIQALISIGMFLFPELRQWFFNSFYENIITDNYLSALYQDRGYGYSQSLLFAMPVTQGFLATVAFLLFIKKSPFYFIYIPFLLFSATINARTGLMVFFIGCIVILVLNISKLRLTSFVKILLFIILLSFLTPLSFSVIGSQSKFMKGWVASAFKETIDFLNGNQTGYYEAANNMLFFPENEKLFTGIGENYYTYTYIGGMRSDIGYVNDLFLGGIFFVILLYGSIIFLMISSIRKREFYLQNLILLMIITTFIVNIKGFAFRQNVFMNLFFLLLFIIVYYGFKSKAEEQRYFI